MNCRNETIEPCHAGEKPEEAEMTSRREAQNNLDIFSERWKDYNRTEIQGSQTFLNEFFQCFEINFSNPNDLPYEHRDENDGYADCYLRSVAIIEMKHPVRYREVNALKAEYQQIEGYWRSRGKAAPYLVLCNFRDFLVYDTRGGRCTHIKLGELATRIDSFMFLWKMSATFKPEQEAVNRSASQKLAEIYSSIVNRKAAPEKDARVFVMQCLFCMFAEKTGYLEGMIFSRLVHEIIEGKDNSSNLLCGNLFKRLDEQDSDKREVHGVKVSRFNGSLFNGTPPDIKLDQNEVRKLHEACNFDWEKISPEIFGSLFEATVDAEDARDNGISYTYADDIMKVVDPCIVDYWEELMSKCQSSDDWKNLHDKLKKYIVLDPACGSGNFLLIAYKEIKNIEARILHAYAASLNSTFRAVQESQGLYSVTNLHGIEKRPFAALLTRVSLWIAKRQACKEHGFIETSPLLDDLKHISGADSEVGTDALFVRWPDADVVIGNPPYCGAKRIKKTRGQEYIDRLKEKFPNHNMMADYCSYWYRKAIDEIRVGARIGMVSTNTIRQTNTRESSLDLVVKEGGEIFNAIYEQKWSGASKVLVSIVNFVNKTKYIPQEDSEEATKSDDYCARQRLLDGKRVDIISPRLLSFDPGWEAKPLSENGDLAFVGCQPTGDGFFLSEETALSLMENEDNKTCIKRYLGGKDVNQTPDNSPQRYIIDFHDWPLEKCERFEEILNIVETNVKPERDLKDRKSNREGWWKYAETRPLMRRLVLTKSKFIAICMRTKYPVFSVIDNKDKNIIPANTAVVIAWQGWGKFGVLQSVFHKEWFDYQCSTLKADPSYNNTFVFETFPFPYTIDEKVRIKAELLHGLRKATCIKEDFGLTELYNQIEKGAYKEIKTTQNDLNKLVAKAYGFPVSKIKDREAIIRFLLEENKKRYEEEIVELDKSA